MGSQLFKQFIQKAVLSKQGPPGPAPRQGLQWKPQTHRWIRPQEQAQQEQASEESDDTSQDHMTVRTPRYGQFHGKSMRVSTLKKILPDWELHEWKHPVTGEPLGPKMEKPKGSSLGWDDRNKNIYGEPVFRPGMPKYTQKKQRGEHNFKEEFATSKRANASEKRSRWFYSIYDEDGIMGSPRWREVDTEGAKKLGLEVDRLEPVNEHGQWISGKRPL